MTAAIDQIRSRGHWHRVFRPLPFKEERVDFGKLYPLVQQAAVDYRGWGFPKINARMPPEYGQDYVGQVFDWEDRIEAWRFYLSGQFVSLQAFMLDWREKATYLRPNLPGDATAYLGLFDVVGSFTEFYEFAARLAMAEAGDERVSLTIMARNLKDRTLVSESPLRRLHQAYKTSAPEFRDEQRLTRTELVAQPGEVALVGARKLLQRFGCPVELATLREIQAELTR